MRKSINLCHHSCFTSCSALQNRTVDDVNVPVAQVSERAGHIIQYDKFYIHELDDLIDIRNDYVTWVQRQMYPMVSLLLLLAPLFSLLHLFMIH